MSTRILCISALAMLSALSVSQVWSKMGSSGISTNSTRARIATDSSDNLYVATGVNNTSADVVIRKYSSSGTLISSQTLGGSNDEYVVDLVCKNDKIYVLTSDINTGAGTQGVMLVRLDNSLSTEWTQWDSVSSRPLSMEKILVRPDYSKVYIVGTSGTTTNTRIYYARFTASSGAKDYGQEYSLGADSLSKGGAYCYDNFFDAVITSTDGITIMAESSFPNTGTTPITRHPAVIRLGDSPYNAYAWYYQDAPFEARFLTNNGNTFSMVSYYLDPSDYTRFVNLDASLGVTSYTDQPSRDYSRIVRGIVNSSDAMYGVGFAPGWVGFGPNISTGISVPYNPARAIGVVGNDSFYYAPLQSSVSKFTYIKYDSSGNDSVIEIDHDIPGARGHFIQLLTSNGKTYAIAHVSINNAVKVYVFRLE